MMKTLWIIFLIILSMNCLFAQEETLVDGEFHSGGYGGPVWKVGLINGKVGMFSGGRGGWIINHRVAIGGGGYSLLFNIDTDAVSENGKPLYLDMSYGGFEIEYIHHSDRLVHWTIHTLLGRGAVKLKEHNPNEAKESDSFYILEPSFNIDLNVASWFRIGFGGSYRIALGVDLDGVSSSDICGPSALIIFKFGRF